MAERHISFEQLSDIMAFRAIVPSEEACYQALGVIHRRWPMVPGRFKDYISTPKRNGYRSLHTSVIHADNTRVEVQIRTEEMHEEAELGLAAHWAYKQDKVRPETQVSWIRDLVEILDNAESPEELLEHTRMAMYQDRIFAFTPKGELHQLPKGATPIDFAYAVHTDLGDQAVGAKINGRVVPLKTSIENGDQVQILRSKAQEPQANWLSFAITGKARAAIRRHLRHKEREETQALGRKIYDEILSHLPAPLARRRDRCGAEAAEADRRSGADGSDRAAPHHRFRGDGGLDAGIGRHRHDARGADPDQRDLDQGPDPRRRVRPGRMLPSGAGRPHRRPAPPERGDRGPYDQLPAAGRERRCRLGRSRLGRQDRGRAPRASRSRSRTSPVRWA